MIQTTYIVTLTTLEPFRVGGKEDPLSEAENPVALVGGRICIPGRSLKGAYRAELERWLNDRFFDERAGRWNDPSLQPCIPATRLSADEQELVRRGRFRGRACAYAPAQGQRGRGGGHRTTTNNVTICPICYLLGAQGLVGFVNVPFLFTDVRYETLYSARLERTSHTVMSGTNRSYQLVPPDTELRGEIEVLLEDNLLSWKLGQPRPLKESQDADAWLKQGDNWTQERVLTEMIVDRFHAIQRLGGYRSKGFGRVSIQLAAQQTG
jgi:CRISPR/Cas system CSM-associated protein Csm3 (group 7 of RAMP superfamily)